MSSCKCKDSCDEKIRQKGCIALAGLFGIAIVSASMGSLFGSSYGWLFFGVFMFTQAVYEMKNYEHP